MCERRKETNIERQRGRDRERATERERETERERQREGFPFFLVTSLSKNFVRGKRITRQKNETFLQMVLYLQEAHTRT